MLGTAQRYAIAFGQAEVRLAVAVHRSVAAAADRDGDKRGVGNGDWPMRERMRRDRS